MRTVGGTLLLLACGALEACAPSPSSGGFKSDDPAAKLYAITDAARRRDLAAIPALIDALWSDDPAVRLLAEDTLEEITGQNVGYRHFDPPEQRAAAIGRWTDLARREGWLTTPAASTPTPAKSADAVPQGASGLALDRAR